MHSLSIPRLPIIGVVAMLALPVTIGGRRASRPLPALLVLPASLPGSQEPPPQAQPSAWFDGDRRQFANVVEGLQAELFIAPVQIQRCGLDRSTRSLMGARVAMALSKRHGVETGNPYAIQRALGEGLRRIDATAIRSMATKAGAKRLVMLYAGHDRASNLIVTAQVFRRNGNDTTWTGAAPVDFTSPIGESEAPGGSSRTRSSIGSWRRFSPVQPRSRWRRSAGRCRGFRTRWQACSTSPPGVRSTGQ